MESVMAELSHGNLTQTEASHRRIQLPGLSRPSARTASLAIRARGSFPLSSTQKTTCGCRGRVQTGWYDRVTRRARDLGSGDTRIYLEFEVRRLHYRACNAVKREKLDFLADNPFYTKRFAWFVGRRCRTSRLTDVAKETDLSWRTVRGNSTSKTGAAPSSSD